MNDIVNDNITISITSTNNTINDDFLEEDDTTNIIILSLFTGFIIFCVFCNPNDQGDAEDMQSHGLRGQKMLEIKVVG